MFVYVVLCKFCLSLHPISNKGKHNSKNMVTRSLEWLQRRNKKIYVALVIVLGIFLVVDYIPGAHQYLFWVTPPVALFMGLVYALSCGQAHPKFNKKMSKYLLQYSVVGLGFGMNLHAALQSGREGMEFTIISVIGTMVIGWFIGRKLFHVDRNTSYLVSSGTAICGGSAIAAVGPVIRAKDSEMSVALATIFVLNAVALFLFPRHRPCSRYDPAGIRYLGCHRHPRH